MGVSGLESMVTGVLILRGLLEGAAAVAEAAGGDEFKGGTVVRGGWRGLRVGWLGLGGAIGWGLVGGGWIGAGRIGGRCWSGGLGWSGSGGLGWWDGSGGPEMRGN